MFRGKFVKVMMQGILVLLLVMAVSCSNTKEEQKEYDSITVETAKTMMDEETGYVILDVRTEEEYETGYIPGAINLPLDMIETNYSDVIPNKDQMILIYCRSGVRSKEAAKELQELGYTNLYEFGGILDWDGELEGIN